MNTMSTRTAILPPDPARTIESLRDAGYSFNAALADIIDNSIAADASRVDVRITRRHDGNLVVSVLDNGCGMDSGDLLNAMTYGAKERANRYSLGKFGMGLKTASTAFSRQLEVITRASATGAIHKAVWDLDHVISTGNWELLLPTASEDEIALMNEGIGESSGTLVVWRKVDRLLTTRSGSAFQDPNSKRALRAYHRVLDSFRDHVAIVYQRFIDHGIETERNVTITLNGEAIVAHDPFQEQGGIGELLHEERIAILRLDADEDVAATMRVFVLPRREDFPDGDAGAKAARLGAHTQGIYVYRENRLIDGPNWLRIYSNPQDPHYSLIRVDLSFDHRLDDTFRIDFKKSRIILDEEVREHIEKVLKPLRSEARMRYDAKEKTPRKKARNAHEASNTAISDNAAELTTVKVTDMDTEAGIATLENREGIVHIRMNTDDELTPDDVHIVPVDGLNDGMLWEKMIQPGNRVTVKINTNHPFYHRIYVPNFDNSVTVQGIDSLLWAMVTAELNNTSEKRQLMFDDMRAEISRILRHLVDHLPEPDFAALADDDDSRK